MSHEFGILLVDGVFRIVLEIGEESSSDAVVFIDCTLLDNQEFSASQSVDNRDALLSHCEVKLIRADSPRYLPIFLLFSVFLLLFAIFNFLLLILITFNW